VPVGDAFTASSRYRGGDDSEVTSAQQLTQQFRPSASQPDGRRPSHSSAHRPWPGQM